MAGKSSEYFSDFSKMTTLSCKAAEYLVDSMEHFDPVGLPERMRQMHAIEHDSDEVRHRMMRNLAKDFITPIEREDILQMANVLDEVTDLIEDVLIRVYMYNITAIRPEALAFARLILRCCQELDKAMGEFSDFHKSKTLLPSVIEVNSLEEEGDKIYMDAMRRLYVERDGAVETLTWSETFDRLEDCCDACEHVANVIESVIMKNS